MDDFFENTIYPYILYYTVCICIYTFYIYAIDSLSGQIVSFLCINTLSHIMMSLGIKKSWYNLFLNRELKLTLKMPYLVFKISINYQVDSCTNI